MADNNQDLIKFITSRQSKLESDKSNFNDRMQDIADYVCPHREDIRGNRVSGEKKGSKIFDGTAVNAAVLATDGIHGYHVSPAFAWFKYMMSRKELNKNKDIIEWLQDVEFSMYAALNRSNFYDEMWLYIYDGFTLGTAPIYGEEDLAEGRIVFEAVHPGEAFISENKYGCVDVLHRLRKLSARKLVQMFGEKNCPDPIKQAYKNNPFFEYEVIHAVYPREEFDSRKKDAKNKRFASVWYLKSGNHILRESGFDKFPYNVWRYIRNGKEPYGLSPAMMAMADIKTLNLMGKTLLGAAQQEVDPAYQVPSYLEGKVQLMPRGLNFMRGPNDKISPVRSGVNFPIGIDREQAKQDVINKWFHVDTFLMLANMQGSGDRTAFEVSELMAEKAAVLGAELGPLNTQISNILENVFDIETAAGRIPPPPDILQEMAARDPQLRFDPIYMGPLAQSQREKFGKDPIRKFMADMSGIIQVNPETLDKIDFDKTTDVLAELNGVPQEILRSDDQVKVIRQGRIQAQMQESQTEDMERMAAGVKTASEADKNMGGKLSQMMAGMTQGVRGGAA